ncbi:MAG TPA: transcription elongation factor GreA [Gammaproteobacteria bacterium]|nr:transcription elongation factor GreA [Gammaproteobacteria bacterium]
MQRVPMTKQGIQDIKELLEKFKNKDSPRIIQAIADARAHGDLKENAEYHAAKEEQGLLEARIANLEGQIQNAQVIDVKNLPKNGKVVFGTTVTLEDMSNNKILRFTIVGESESNFTKGKLSYLSPIAKSIIGKGLDEIVEASTPGGIIDYQIKEIEYI